MQSLAFKYKELTGSTEYSEDDSCFYGRILNITDLFIYEAHSREAVEKAFHEAVDRYLEGY